MLKVKISQKIKENIKLDIRILFLGDSLSGKSTLVSVLTYGKFDDGDGHMKRKLIKH